MLESKRLEKEVKKLSSRREELVTERQETATSLLDLQQKIIGGKGSIDSATALQARLNVIDQTLGTVNEKLGNLQTELETAEQFERREVAFNRISELSAESLKLVKTFEAKLSEFDEFCRSFGAETLEIKSQIRQVRTKFHENFASVVPNVENLALMHKHFPQIELARDAIFEELAKRKINLSVLRSERIFASLHFLDDMTAASYRPPQTEFGGLAWRVLEITANAQAKSETENDLIGEFEPENVKESEVV